MDLGNAVRRAKTSNATMPSSTTASARYTSEIRPCRAYQMSIAANAKALPMEST